MLNKRNAREEIMFGEYFSCDSLRHLMYEYIELNVGVESLLAAVVQDCNRKAQRETKNQPETLTHTHKENGTRQRKCEMKEAMIKKEQKLFHKLNDKEESEKNYVL